MTLTLDLTPDEAAPLESEATRRGLDSASLLRGLLPVLLPKSQKRTDLDEALTLYEARLLSLGTAAKLAGMSSQKFLEALGRANISPFGYTAEDVFADVGASR